MLKCHYQISVAKPPVRVITPRPYPYLPVSLGDYLRKRRLDFNLTQKQVAIDILKTSIDNVRNWEANRRQLSLCFRPRIIEFINICPYDASLPLGLRLKERRENFGLSIKKLSTMLNVDPCTIASWERYDHQPSQRYIKIIEGFLKSYSPETTFVPKSESSNTEDLSPDSPIPSYIQYDTRWTIGRKMTVWRLSVGLSQRKLAKLAGICFQSVCRWEKEQRVPKPKYQKLILKTVILYLDSFSKVGLIQNAFITSIRV